jgi:CelD/BcsL family acetyltransferase involved in cellulose biosynthesis
MTAVHIGTSGEPDSETVRVEYNRLLVDPRHRVAFARELLHLAGRPPFRSRQTFLDGFSPEELHAFVASEPSMLLERKVSYVTELRKIGDEGQTVLDALRRHTASKIRRTARRLEEAHGPITVQWASTIEEAHEIFDELCALHSTRWASRGLPGAFASERFSRFHRGLIDRLFAQGRILLARVRAGDKTIGCDYGMIEHGRVLSYQWGIAKFDDSRLSPGLLTGASIMQAALDRGLAEYDWLAGDVLYKRELSTSARELIWARHTSGFYIQMLDAAAKTAKVAHRTIRKRPSTPSVKAS